MNINLIRTRLLELREREHIAEKLLNRFSGIPWIFQSGDDRLFLADAKKLKEATAIRIDEVQSLGRRL